MKKDSVNNSKAIIEHIFINVLFADHKFDSYVINLETEINNIKQQYNFNIKSIYLAGNDLLALSLSQLTKLLTLIATFNNKNLVEYSFECSYALASFEQLKLLKTFNVNRLVWKVITFQQKLLTLIDEKYHSPTMINNIKNGIDLGFNNFSLDLKYNLPHQKATDISLDIEQALIFKTPHISYDSYDEAENPDSKEIINQLLLSEKYDNYEVFSYSKNDKNQAQQTLAYLNLKNWYGLGPNAASFIKTKNQILTINNDQQWKTESKGLTKQDYYQLVLIQGLMLRKGIVLNAENQEAFNYYQAVIKSLMEQQLLIINDNVITTTNQGWILLNEILTVIINNK